MAPVIYPAEFQRELPAPPPPPEPEPLSPVDQARDAVARLDAAIHELAAIPPHVLAQVWKPTHHHTGMSGAVGIVAMLDGMIARLEFEKRRLRVRFNMETRKQHYNREGKLV